MSNEYVTKRWQEILHEVNHVNGFAIVVHASDDTGNDERVLTGDEVDAWFVEHFDPDDLLKEVLALTEQVKRLEGFIEQDYAKIKKLEAENAKLLDMLEDNHAV